MSALSLGTMDEKLQMCFDLFDSEGRRALALTDVCELCTVLFRVALAQGFENARKPCTDGDADEVSSLTGVRSSQSQGQPWRSMLLRMLAAARRRTPAGIWLLEYEDFRNAAYMEP